MFKVGNKLSPDDLEVGMIVDVLTGDCGYRECKILVLKYDFVGFETPDFDGAVFNYERFRNNPSIKFLFRRYGTETSSQQHNTSDEQSIEEAVRTLSQAAQALSVPITVDKSGNIVIYSDYHEQELTFDTTEKFMQYIECVKQMNKFGEQ